MSAASPKLSGSKIAIVDTRSWAIWFRRAWWGNRFIVYFACVEAIAAIAVLNAPSVSPYLDRTYLLSTPTGLHALAATIVLVVAYRHIGRVDFRSAPIYSLLWLAFFLWTWIFSLLGNECVHRHAGVTCSPSDLGVAVETAIWIPLSIWIGTSWLIISRAALRDPVRSKDVELVRTILESKGNRNFMQRARPALLTFVSMIPVFGLLALLHWSIFPELFNIVFPKARNIHEPVGLTHGANYYNMLVLRATFAEFGVAPFILLILEAITAALVLFFGYRLARRFALIWSGRFWAHERNPTILLLRSFADDLTSIRPTSILKRLGMIRIRLEEAIARELFHYGTLLAVGQPGERLPKLGAYRIYLDDETWQHTVLGYINSSSFVVVIGGTTEWVRWEIEQVVNSPCRSKLIYVLPPGEIAQRLSRLSLFCDALRLTPTDRSEVEAHANQILAISTLDDGRLCLCTGTPKHQSDYQLAAQMGMLVKVVQSI